MVSYSATSQTLRVEQFLEVMRTYVRQRSLVDPIEIKGAWDQVKRQVNQDLDTIAVAHGHIEYSNSILSRTIPEARTALLEFIGTIGKDLALARQVRDHVFNHPELYRRAWTASLLVKDSAIVTHT